MNETEVLFCAKRPEADVIRRNYFLSMIKRGLLPKISKKGRIILLWIYGILTGVFLFFLLGQIFLIHQNISILEFLFVIIWPVPWLIMMYPIYLIVFLLIAEIGMKNVNVQQGSCQYIFTKDRFYARSEGQSVEIPYERFTMVKERRNTFVIRANKHIEYIFQKSDFLKGEPSQFKAFIQNAMKEEDRGQENLGRRLSDLENEGETKAVFEVKTEVTWEIYEKAYILWFSKFTLQPASVYDKKHQRLADIQFKQEMRLGEISEVWEYAFKEEAFQYKKNGIIYILSYQEIVSLFETEKYFVFLTSEGAGMLYKEALGEEVQSFQRFLEEKCQPLQWQKVSVE